MCWRIYSSPGLQLPCVTQLSLVSHGSCVVLYYYSYLNPVPLHWCRCTDMRSSPPPPPPLPLPPPIQWLLAKLNGPGSGGFSLITNRDPTEISWSSAEPGIIKSVSKPSRMVYNKSIFPLHLLKWQHRIVLFFLRRRKVLSCTSSLWDLILWPIRKVCVGSSTLIWSIVTVLSLQQKLSQFKKLLVT